MWVTSFFTSGAQWIQNITVGWLVWTQWESPLLVGLVGGARFVPFVIVGPLAGVLIDRFDRRRLLIGVQVVMAASAFTFAVLVSTEAFEVWHAAAYMLIMGIAWTVMAPLRQALTANTVPRKDLMNAIALKSMAFNSTRILGPVAGGFLIAFVGMEVNFFIQGSAYIIVMFLILPLKTPYQEAGKATEESVISNLKEGLQYVARDSVLLGLMAMTFIPTLFIMPLTQLLPVVTAKVFKEGPPVLGLLMSGFGVGALLGAVFIASVGNFKRKGLMAIVTLIASTLAMILFAQSHWLALSVVLLALLGVFNMVFSLANNTLLQSTVPDSIRGRVSSIYMAEHSLIPLGSLILGSLMEVMDAQRAITLTGGVALALALLIALRLRRLRHV